MEQLTTIHLASSVVQLLMTDRGLKISDSWWLLLDGRCP